MANVQACLGDIDSVMSTVGDLTQTHPENGYLHYRLGHVLAEIGHLGGAVRMLDSAVRHGFLSAQLWRQEELLALSRLRRRHDYAVVARRLEANVDRCRHTYAANLPVAAFGPIGVKG